LLGDLFNSPELGINREIRVYVRASGRSSAAMVNTAAVAAAKGSRGSGLPLASLNHISIVCRSLQESLTFYTDVLGFFPVRRPGSFDFDGAWYTQFTSNVFPFDLEGLS
jgi:hypothetical protein